MAEKQVTEMKGRHSSGKVRRTMSWLFKPMVDVPSWLGYSHVKSGARVIKGAARQLFMVTESSRNETYEAAILRLNLSEERIAKQYQRFKWLFVFFFLLSLVILFYAIYMVMKGSVFGFIFSLLLMVLSLGNAFRYHFWMFQIKHKKLGCTFKEWYHSSIGEEKNN